MKLLSSFFFILLISSFVPLILNPQSAEASTPQQTRGKNYVDIDYKNGTHVWSSAPEWITDNGAYKPYKLFEDDTIVKVETMQGSFIFDKSNCALSFYNGGVIGGQQPTIGSDSYIVLGTTLGSQNFVKVNSINNAACQTLVIENGDDIEVRGTKHVDNVGTFKIRYIKNDGEELKTQIEPTNENPAWTNHKLGITQIIQVPQNITLGDTIYNLANFNNTVLDKTWLSDHKAELIQLSDKIHFNFDLGFQYVEKITISWNGSVAKLVIDYWYNTPQISPGQTLVIDPTYGYTAATNIYKFGSTTAVGAACSVTYSTTSTIPDDRHISIGDSDLATTCSVIAMWWDDLSSIPTEGLINVTDTKIRIDFITDAQINAKNCDYYEMKQDPTTATGQQMYDDIRLKANIQYLNNDAGCVTIQNNYVVDLGATADQHIYRNVKGYGVFNNKFGASALFDDMTRDAATAHSTPRFGDTVELQITYTAKNPDAITDLAALQVTGTSVILVWTQPNLHGATLSGYQLNYTTPHGEPLTVITNDTHSAVTQGTVSGLTELTEYSFRVSAWSNIGNNDTGNIVNTTILKDFGVGSLNFTETNPDIIPIRFQRNDINTTALFLNVTYSNTMTLACDLHYKFAQTNRTYHSIASTTVGNEKHSAFQFLDIDNEIVDVFCWNESAGNMLNNTDVNSTNSGRYLIIQTVFPLVEQIQQFRAGEFGTLGMFGVIDFVTLAVIIISMIGLNRVNESVGGVFVVAIVGVCWFFGIIDLLNFIFAAIALVIMLIVASTKKD